MDFLKLLTRVLLKKATDLYTNKPDDHKTSLPRCEACGRPFLQETPVDGKCPLCRLADQQREQTRSNQRETRQHDDSMGLEDAYRILNLTAGDSVETVKKRYRELVKECHVDSLPKDLPDYLVKAANKRFHEIREAYEKIMAARSAS